MQKGYNRYEVPFELELAISKATNEIKFYKTYIELSKEIGIAPNTLWRAITGEKVSIKTWEKIKKWDPHSNPQTPF